MPEQCVHVNHCGTFGAIWLNGRHPTGIYALYSTVFSLIWWAGDLCFVAFHEFFKFPKLLTFRSVNEANFEFTKCLILVFGPNCTEIGGGWGCPPDPLDSLKLIFLGVQLQIEMHYEMYSEIPNSMLNFRNCFFKRRGTKGVQWQFRSSGKGNFRGGCWEHFRWRRFPGTILNFKVPNHITFFTYNIHCTTQVMFYRSWVLQPTKRE